MCGACEEAYEDILKDAETKGVISYHGLVKDMRAMYQEASCVVLPSFYPEGQSNVLLEGAASGRPLITTNHPGCREAVDDEITGFLVKKQDAQDLYAKVCCVFCMSVEDRRQMGIQGRKKIERDFDRNIVINTYKQRLNSIV